MEVVVWRESRTVVKSILRTFSFFQHPWTLRGVKYTGSNLKPVHTLKATIPGSNVNQSH